MQCDDVTAQLLAPDADLSAEIRAHLDGCAACSAAARSAGALDRVLASSLVIAPPAALQSQLAQLALASAAPPRPVVPARTGLGAFFDRLTPAFTVGAVQGVVMFLLGVAIWELWHVAGAVSSAIGSIPFALELVASSPAGAYLPDVSDLVGSIAPLVPWAVVAVLVWVVLDAGLLLPRRDVKS